jgi:hypothetical protein
MKNQMDELKKPKFTQFPSPALFQYLGAFNFLPPNLRTVNFPRRERDVGRMKNQMDEKKFTLVHPISLLFHFSIPTPSPANSLPSKKRARGRDAGRMKNQM